VDICRLDHRRIVEHWDVQQIILEQPANNNTVF
jgi:predicted SnoaL-like aldol condensation-catalyzing enzyme